MENSKTEDASHKSIHNLYVTRFKKPKQLSEKKEKQQKANNQILLWIKKIFTQKEPVY